MALVIKDRIKETSTTTGTGTLTLAGASTGFKAFSEIGSGNTTYYAISDGTDWEVGLGTVGSGTLSRDTILASSNAGSAVSWNSDVKDVFCTYPADKAVYLDASGNIDINGGTIDGVTIGGSSAAAITGTTITGTSFVSSGDMTFGDNDKAIFGAGSDLEIYSNGDSGIIWDKSATGDLILRGSNLYLQTQTGENALVVTPDSDVRLYYDNALKLATTSTGIDVTGSVVSDGASLDGAVVINESGADVDFRIESDTDANAFFLEGSSGNVGIGTSSPADALHVIGSGRFTRGVQLGIDGVDATSYISQYRSTVETIMGPLTTRMLFGTVSNHDIAIQTNNAEAMRITSTGSVGIGTSNPAVLLDVLGDGLIQRLRSTTSTGAYLRFDGTGTSFPFVGLLNGIGTFGNTDASPIRFTTNSAERMRIDSTGSVGIGTSSPSYKLDVIGNTNGSIVSRVGNLSTGASSQAILQLGAGATAERYVNLNTNYTSQYFQISGVNISTSYQDFDTQIFRNNSGSERMRIDSSGNTTPGVDNTQDLGSSSKRWNDLYVGGGVYLGGTGAANYLDDYEEGTWIATITTTGTDFTTASRGTDGWYTKVGNLVTAHCGVSISSPTGGTGALIVTGLPFTSTYATIGSSVRWGRVDLPGSFTAFGYVIAGGTYLAFEYPNNNAGPTALTAADLNGNITPYFNVSISYITA